jgi:hypothetical protein
MIGTSGAKTKANGKFHGPCNKTTPRGSYWIIVPLPAN